MASGIVTSRMSFSFGSFEACPFRRWVRRRNEAIERSRTSSALSAVTSVRRPRCLAGAGLAVVFGGAAGRATPPGRGGSGADLHPRRKYRRRCPERARRARRARVLRPLPRFAETLLGFGLGLAFGLLVLAMAFFSPGAWLPLLRVRPARCLPCCCGAWLLPRRGDALRRRAVSHRKGAGARGALVFGQRAQHHAGTERDAGAAAGASSARVLRALPWRRRLGRMHRIRRVAANAALAALLDHHLLGPAMA